MNFAFQTQKSLIGMVHVGSLPGTPRNETTVELIAAQAAQEARVYQDAGFDAVMIENMHDAPYVHGDRLGPEIVAAMTRIGLEVEAAIDLPIGVQILSGGARHAIAVAQSIGSSFVRVENFVFSHVADEGLLVEAEAGPLLRYRRLIGAEDVRIFADIKKKHASHAITADVSLGEAAEAAAFFGADGLVISGTATGRPTNPDDVRRAKEASGLPVLVGSGANAETIGALLEHADAVIIGSATKQDGVWSHPVDAAACVRIARAASDAGF